MSLCGSGPTSENGACGRLSLASSSPMRKGDNVHIFTVRQGLSLIFKWKSLKSIFKKTQKACMVKWIYLCVICIPLYRIFLGILIIFDCV